MYRVEIYDMYQRSFVSFFMLDKDAVIYDDYLSPQTFNITAPADLVCEVRNTIKIAEDTTTVFSGYIDNIERTKTETTLTLAPLILLLNEQSIQNTHTTDFAGQINWQIYYDFRRPNPSLYTLPMYQYSNSPTTNWGGITVPYGAVLKNDMECILLARQTYGKFMYFGFANGSGWQGVPFFGFRTFTGQGIFEADLDNVIEKQVTESTDNGKNILIIWIPRENDPGNYNYYTCLLLDDGTIETTGDRKSEIAHPSLVEKVEREYRTYSTSELQALAIENLKPKTDNLEIKLTYRRKDPLARPEERRIGLPSRIFYNGKEVETFLTAKEYHRDTITLTFGMTRQGLVQKLNERED